MLAATSIRFRSDPPFGIGQDRERPMHDRFADIRTEESVTLLKGVAGLVFVLLMSGCARPGTPPPQVPSGSSPPQARTEAAAPTEPQAPLPSAPPPVVAIKPEIVAVGPASGSAPPSTATSAGQAIGKTASPIAKAPAKSPAPPAPAAQPSKRESVPPDIAKPKAPPLDLASLEQRLKDTKAIGVLTKITLKNQVDDLLSQFRAFYQGKLKTDLADLRRSYDLLVLKVLSLLQDSDQALATAIAASREAIWGILSDPAKFAKNLMRRGRRHERTFDRRSDRDPDRHLFAAPSLAADDESTKDLFTVITLHEFAVRRSHRRHNAGRKRSPRNAQGCKPLPRLSQRQGASGCRDAMKALRRQERLANEMRSR